MEKVEPVTAYLSLGSNLGDRKANLSQAITILRDEDLVTSRMSSFFETEPVGSGDQPWFLNGALEVSSKLSPRDLLERCLDVERSMGRVRSFPGAPRTLDLDILLFGDQILSEKDLIVPHPRMAERRFVLIPLSEIAPDVIHPLLGKSIQSLLGACPDMSVVRFYSPGDSF